LFDAIGAEGISISDTEEKFIEAASSADGEEDAKFDEIFDEELGVDLTPGSSDTVHDPVRLYLREMAIVPLLTREGEVEIARRIERGRTRTLKTISRTPICIAELIDIGDFTSAKWRSSTIRTRWWQKSATKSTCELRSTLLPKSKKTSTARCDTTMRT
jgi:hypothetical protein